MQDPRSPMEIVLKMVNPGDAVDEEERNVFDKAIDDAEDRLHEALGQQGWEGYNDQARHYVRRGLSGRGTAIYGRPHSTSEKHVGGFANAPMTVAGRRALWRV